MSSDYRELLLGCGHDRRKRYCAVPHHPRGWQSLTGPVTLDVDRRVSPDIYCDLDHCTPWVFFAREKDYAVAKASLSDAWDEIHAYQVLEHLGSQGDARALFAVFSEIWRILKPGGYLVAEVPSRFSGNLWGDPGHTRAIVPETLVFLDQEQYRRQLDVPSEHRTSMSDYRNIYRADFKIVDTNDNRQNFVFVLQAVKPSRMT